MYQKIFNPKTNRMVSIYGKTGMKIINNYLNYIQQFGGHDGPCAVNPSTNKCKKSKKSDGNCEVSPKGRCRKISQKSSPLKGELGLNPVEKVAQHNPDEFQAAHGTEKEIYDQWLDMVEYEEFNSRYAHELSDYLGYYPSEDKLAEMMTSQFGENIKEHFGIATLQGDELEGAFDELYSQYLVSQNGDDDSEDLEARFKRLTEQ